MENCNFENNSITPLKLIKTLLSVSGNLNFTNNTAYRGGAIVFLYNNSLSLSENSRVTFVGNRAVHTGCAMYIVTSTVYNSGVFCTNCFLKLNNISKYEKQLIFTNNSAGQGGDVVYGGRMESTCPIYRTDFSFHHTYDHISCLSMFLDISVINPKSLSPISSEPSRVCFCNKRGIPDFFPLYHHTEFSIYPGQKISISAVVVGQNFGTVAGSVFAQFLSSKLIPQLDVRESAQEVQHIYCNQLLYTIFSLIDREDNYRVLILTAVKRTITETNELEPITKQIAYYENGWSDDILDTPVYVRVNLMPCPPGFLLNASGPPKCDCNNQLRSLPDVACNIQYSTLQRRGLVWIGPLTDDNDTITDVVSSENCPLNYCKDEAVGFQLNASSAQCNYRSRVWRVPAWSQSRFRVCSVSEMLKQVPRSTHSICLGWSCACVFHQTTRSLSFLWAHQWVDILCKHHQDKRAYFPTTREHKSANTLHFLAEPGSWLRDLLFQWTHRIRQGLAAVCDPILHLGHSRADHCLSSIQHQSGKNHRV